MIGSRIVIGLLVVALFSTCREPASVKFHSEGAEFTRLWFLFRPGDCWVTRELIGKLNQANASDALTVQPVMLRPPPDPTDAMRIVASFDFSRRPILDRTGEWERRLAEMKVRPPAVVLVRGERLLAVVSVRESNFVNFPHQLVLDPRGV